MPYTYYSGSLLNANVGQIQAQINSLLLVSIFLKVTHLQSLAIEHLASADAFWEISGDRYQARCQALAVIPYSTLLEAGEPETDDLLMNGPMLEESVMEDYASIGLTLCKHLMEISRLNSLLINASDVSILLISPVKALFESRELLLANNVLVLQVVFYSCL